MNELPDTNPLPLSPEVLDSFREGEIQADMNVGELQQLPQTTMMNKQSSLKTDVSFHEFTPLDYLKHLESSIPTELISYENYRKICHLDSFFNEKITSFFGFETRLNSDKSSSDYLFAVSSLHGEKEALNTLLHSSQFQSYTKQSDEWNQLKRFTKEWTTIDSIINKKIHGLWLEFDIGNGITDLLNPCVFIHTSPLRNNTCPNYVIDTAIPTLIGKTLPNHLQDSLRKAILELPDDAYIMDIGFMLPRAEEGMRLLINRIKPENIVPYLKKLGLSDNDYELQDLIEELQQYVNRIVLHIAIGKELIPKIGIECSFAPDLYSKEEGWDNFFKYLKAKGLCISMKHESLKQYMGTDVNDESDFDIETFSPSVKAKNRCSNVHAVSRYISHVKLVYQPGKPIQAKAYPGVRLFNKDE